MKNTITGLRLMPFLLFFVFLMLPACGQKAQGTVTGLDNVIQNNFRKFTGKKIGIICNHTSLSKSGDHIVDLFHEKCEVRAIFAPEHGYRGDEAAGAHITDGRDTKTGIKIYSLYGKNRKPTSEMLQDIDLLIYDIQDVGVRFYTYISTMTHCMTAAAEHDIEFVVLDRPNPIRGDRIEGPMLKDGFQSFVGMHKVPVRYGLTAGEYANYINKEGLLENGVKAKLQIFPVKNWTRDQWYDETDLPWTAPSPNMPTLKTAIVYPGMCFIEGTNLSEGRGTKSPFLLFGAPWLDNKKLSGQLDKKEIAGVEFVCEDFTPVEIKGMAYNPKHENELCHGLRLNITDRDQYNPVKTTATLLQLIAGQHPEEFKWRESSIDRLSGSSELRIHIDNREVEKLFGKWDTANAQFIEKIQKYFLY